MRRLFSFGKDPLLGLDIGSSAVKIVRLRRDGDTHVVVAAAIAEIPPGERSDNHKASLVRAIRECLRAAQPETKLAVCGIAGPEVAVRDFEFPCLPREEIAGAIALEASQVCPFNTEDSGVDYQLMPDADNKTRGILVSATSAIVANRVRLVSEASLKSVLMDVDGLALLNCYCALDDSDSRGTVAILNVGSSYATLAIMDEDGRPFVRDMTHAGDYIVDQLCAQTGLADEAVREQLNDETADAQVGPGYDLDKACEGLVVDVRKTSRYYGAQAKSGSFEKMLVCGGFALARGFTEAISRQLPFEVSLWNPFEKMRCEVETEQKLVLARSGPALAVAAGLAMRSV